MSEIRVPRGLVYTVAAKVYHRPSPAINFRSQLIHRKIVLYGERSLTSRLLNIDSSLSQFL